MLHVLALFAALGLILPAGAGEAPAGGFVMQNRAPFAAIIGIPGRWPDTGKSIAELSWNASSHSMSERGDQFAVFADGETHTLTARLQFAPSQRLRVGLQLPWMRHTGGFMDNAIDAWHDLFGLKEGIRPGIRSNQLNYVLQRRGADVFRLDRATSGLGDAHLGLTGELGSFERYATPDTISGYLLRSPWRVSLNVKLPTGDIDRLTGSGDTDFAGGVGWRSPDDPGTPLRWWLDVGVVLPGGIDIDGLDTESRVYYYDAALAWRLLRRLDAVVQFAGHSALYSGDAASLGESALQVAIGGLWHLSPRFGLRIGFVEDLRAESAPDFGVEISLLVRRR
ncbi:MAG: DUF3187 family protein [Gammaproteobacteria bacterium]